MTNIIVVLPKLEEAKGVKSILVRSGFQVTGICTTGTQAISQADGLNDGIVICSYKLADMIYTESDQRMLRQRHRMPLHAVKGAGPDQYGKSDGRRRGAPQKKTAHAAEDPQCSG